MNKDGERRDEAEARKEGRKVFGETSSFFNLREEPKRMLVTAHY